MKNKIIKIKNANSIITTQNINAVTTKTAYKNKIYSYEGEKSWAINLKK